MPISLDEMDETRYTRDAWLVLSGSTAKPLGALTPVRRSGSVELNELMVVRRRHGEGGPIGGTSPHQAGDDLHPRLVSGAWCRS